MNEPQKLLIILATYNEIDNLPRLVHQINELIPDAGILVIDDASPDGTGNWCEQSKDKYEKLAVIHRQGKLRAWVGNCRGNSLRAEQGL